MAMIRVNPVPVQVRTGASTLSASATPGEPSATSLRYQVSIGTTARECRVGPTPNTVTLKVGMQGRVMACCRPGMCQRPIEPALGLGAHRRQCPGNPDHVVHPAPAVERDIASRRDSRRSALGDRSVQRFQIGRAHV